MQPNTIALGMVTIDYKMEKMIFTFFLIKLFLFSKIFFHLHLIFKAQTIKTPLSRFISKSIKDRDMKPFLFNGKYFVDGFRLFWLNFSDKLIFN